VHKMTLSVSSCCLHMSVCGQERWCHHPPPTCGWCGGGHELQDLRVLVGQGDAHARGVY
jgi:hypothetical protein